MNICMISQYLPNIGGIENIVSDLSRRLVEKGHAVSVVAPCYQDTAPFTGEAEELNGVRVYRFRRSRGFPFGVDELRDMYSMVLGAHKREEFDILHAHFAKNEGLVGSWAAKKLALPLITTVHGSDIMGSWGGMCERNWSRFWVKRVLKRSFRLSAVSHFLKSEVTKHGIPEDKVRVIHNWIDPDVFSPSPSPSPSSSPTPTSPGNTEKNSDPKTAMEQEHREDHERGRKFRILCARRLVAKNGVDLLLGSLDQLEQSPLEGNYHVTILSGGPEKEKLHDMVAGKPYAPEVEIPGPVNFQTYRTLLQQADVCVVPSRWEGFGMVILEAFAAGTAVLATRVGGIPEIIRNEENGMLAGPGTSSIAEGMIRLYVSPGLERKITENAAKHVRDHFHYTRGIREWISYYESTINDFRKF